MTYSQQSIAAEQTFSAAPDAQWTRKVGTWLASGGYAYCTTGSSENGYQYLGVTTAYPMGTVTANLVFSENGGLYVAGSQHTGTDPTTGVYFGIEVDPATGNRVMFLEVKGVSTMAQTSYGYGLRSEAPVPTGWYGTLRSIRLTLGYGSAWVESTSDNRPIIRLTFGNMLAADVRDSIEAATPSAGLWQNATGGGQVSYMKVEQAHNRKQVTVANAATAGINDDFTTTQNPYNPATASLQSPWASYGTPAAGKLYTSAGYLYIATDAAAGERINVWYNTTQNSNLYDHHVSCAWLNVTNGYSVGFSGSPYIWRVALYSDPVTSGTFGNYRRDG